MSDVRQGARAVRRSQSRVGSAFAAKVGRLAFAGALALLSGCGFAEKMVDRHLNRVLDGADDQTVSEDDRAFFETLFIVDLHADSLLFSRGLEATDWFGRRLGHIDAGRLAEGNIAVQVLSTVSKFSNAREHEVDGISRSCHDAQDPDLVTGLFFLQHQFDDPNARDTLLRRIEIQRRRFEETRGAVRLIRTAGDFESYAEAWQHGTGAPAAAILAIEGLHFYESKDATLRRLWDQGFRMASLTHHFDNRLAGSSTGCQGKGPTELGKQALAEMREMGWTLDLGHASSPTIKKAAKLWREAGGGVAPASPPLVSHTGFEGQCETAMSANEKKDCEIYDQRNIKKQEALTVARQGGTIGIIYWSRQHNANSGMRAGVVTAKIVHTIARLDRWLSRHASGGDLCDATGDCIDGRASRYISLGSDWDGAADAPFDATGLVALIAALRNVKCESDDRACLARGHDGNRRFDGDDIRAMAGWNACRVLLQSLPGGKTQAEALEICRRLKRGSRRQI